MTEPKRTSRPKRPTADFRTRGGRHFVRSGIVFVEPPPEETLDDLAASFREALEAQKGGAR